MIIKALVLRFERNEKGEEGAWFPYGRTWIPKDVALEAFKRFTKAKASICHEGIEVEMEVPDPPEHVVADISMGVKQDG